MTFRDSLVAKKDMRPRSDSEVATILDIGFSASPLILHQVQQRSIRKETRSTRREEFKAKFESGSVTSLSSRASRATTPYRPPQVQHHPFILFVGFFVHNFFLVSFLFWFLLSPVFCGLYGFKYHAVEKRLMYVVIVRNTRTTEMCRWS